MWETVEGIDGFGIAGVDSKAGISICACETSHANDEEGQTCGT